MKSQDENAAAVDPRETTWGIIALFLAVTFVLLSLFPAIERMGPMRQVVLPAWLSNLVPFGLLLVLAVGGVLFALGRMRGCELGLTRDKLKQAAVVIGTLWLLNQAYAAVMQVASSGYLSIDRRWIDPGVGPTLLWALVMFGATALFEEIAFRGFFYSQLELKLRASLGGRYAIVVAAVASQIVFSLSHLPGHLLIRHLSGGALAAQLILQCVAGVLLLLVFLRTRNLWIAVGLHGLADAPTPIFPGTLSWEIPLIIVLLAWPLRRQRAGA